MKNPLCSIKTFLFYLAMFGLVLVLFELIFFTGGYLHLYVHSNFNDPDVEEEAFRILCLGESTVLGTGLADLNDAFPTQLERILEKQFPDLNVQGLNKGVGAIETTAILRNLDNLMIRYNPHLVIVMAGFNDLCGYVDLSIDGERPSKTREIISKSRVYRLYVTFRDLFRLSGEDLPADQFRYIQADDDRETLRFPAWNIFFTPFQHALSEVALNLKLIVETVHSHQSQVWFAGYIQPNAQRDVNPLLSRIADETGIIYVGGYPKFDFQKDHTLFADGWHPSTSGHKLIAEKIVETMREERVLEMYIESDPAHAVRRRTNSE